LIYSLRWKHNAEPPDLELVLIQDEPAGWVNTTNLTLHGELRRRAPHAIDWDGMADVVPVLDAFEALWKPRPRGGAPNIGKAISSAWLEASGPIAGPKDADKNDQLHFPLCRLMPSSGVDAGQHLADEKRPDHLVSSLSGKGSRAGDVHRAQIRARTCR
jgi:hypothetical protein